MTAYLTVSAACREIERQYGLAVRPQDLSNAFYRQRLRDELAPIIGGRRLIRRGSLPEIREVLTRHGHTPDLHDEVNNFFQGNVRGVRRIHAAPAQVVADAILRNPAQRVIVRLHLHF